MADIFTLKSHEIGDYEQIIRDFLSLVDSPDWTPDEVIDDLKEGRAQCWGIAELMIEGIWITKIQNTLKTRYGLVWIAAGSGLSTGVTLFTECTEKWFREMGCEYIEIQGRNGWQKVLPGFAPHSIILRKQLWAADLPATQHRHKDKNHLTTSSRFS